MALDYYLLIQNGNNKIEPATVMESLSQMFSVPKNPSGFLTEVGVTINVFKENDDDSFFGSAYPDICVAFHLDKFEHNETGMNLMLKMVIWLMSYFSGNMIFFFNEQKIFQRMSSQLSLNEESEFWGNPTLSFTNQSQQGNLATSVEL